MLDLVDRSIGAGLGPHEDPAGLVEATALRLLVDLLLLGLELAGLDFKQASLLSRQFLLVGDLLFDGADFLDCFGKALRAYQTVTTAKRARTTVATIHELRRTQPPAASPAQELSGFRLIGG